MFLCICVRVCECVCVWESEERKEWSEITAYLNDLFVFKTLKRSCLGFLFSSRCLFLNFWLYISLPSFQSPFIVSFWFQSQKHGNLRSFFALSCKCLSIEIRDPYFQSVYHVFCVYVLPTIKSNKMWKICSTPNTGNVCNQFQMFSINLCFVWQ